MLLDVPGIIGFREKDPEPSSMTAFVEVDRGRAVLWNVVA
jgi:hypothetical protein